jgi:hypothetical protein
MVRIQRLLLLLKMPKKRNRMWPQMRLKKRVLNKKRRRHNQQAMEMRLQKLRKSDIRGISVGAGLVEYVSQDVFWAALYVTLLPYVKEFERTRRIRVRNCKLVTWRRSGGFCLFVLLQFSL